MKTKLEMMVAYLAGRKGEAPELIRRELADPTSEASLCLEAVRSRSRGIFAADLPAMRGPIPSRPIPTPATARRTAGFFSGTSVATSTRGLPTSVIAPASR